MKSYLLLLITVIGQSCGLPNGDKSHNHGARHEHATGSSQSATAALEGEVLAIHDSVMPKMSDIMRLKKAVSAKVEQADQATLKQRGLTLRRQLDEADRAMMDWMHQYNADTLAKLDQAKATEYLRAEKVKIERVQTQMQTSIAGAEEFVKASKP